jgi:hypothetical protein
MLVGRLDVRNPVRGAAICALVGAASVLPLGAAQAAAGTASTVTTAVRAVAASTSSSYAAGRPAVAAVRDPGYGFLQVVGGVPARWNPCTPIGFRVTWNGVSTSEKPVILAAMRLVSAETGIRFVFQGSSSVIPQRATWPAASSARTSLLIAFALPGHGAGRSDMLGGRIAGRGGPGAASLGIYSRAAVVIDKRDWSVWHMTAAQRQTMYMHELGHALGLAHTRAPRQIMDEGGYYPATPTWGRGDLVGLHRLGRAAGCPVAPGSISAAALRITSDDSVVVTWRSAAGGGLSPSYRVTIHGFRPDGSDWSLAYPTEQPIVSFPVELVRVDPGAGHDPHVTVVVVPVNGMGQGTATTIAVRSVPRT